MQQAQRWLHQRSDVVAQHLLTSQQGGSSNVIKLKAVGEEGGGDDEVGDDPEAIRSMVHFFYHLDYNVDKSSSPVSKGKRKKVDRGSLPGASQEPSLAVDTDTVKHANVFAAAVKYDVPALRRLAVSKFKAAARKDWADPSFAEAAHIAYTTTADDVRDLRDIVGTTINGHQQLLDRPGMEGVLRSNTDLMLELLRMASGLPAIAETGSDDSDLCESCGASLVRTYYANCDNCGFKYPSCCHPLYCRRCRDDNDAA